MVILLINYIVLQIIDNIIAIETIIDTNILMQKKCTIGLHIVKNTDIVINTKNMVINSIGN